MRGFLRHSQEDEGEDEPGDQNDSHSIAELAGVLGIGSCNTEVRVKEGGVGHPEASIRAES